MVGLNIDRSELERAPTGSYDQMVCADLTTYVGHADGNLVICHTVLEHVTDMEKALAGLASIVRPGGVAAMFMPSRNAFFARLNMALPEGVKRHLLSEMLDRHEHSGFKAYYDRCTPAEVRQMLDQNGLVIEREELYFQSNFHAIAGRQAAETFVIVARRI